MLKTWLPVLTGMCCLAFGPGIMGIYGFFVEPLAQEFDVGVAVLNLGPVALLLVPGILAPWVGKLADRLPIRNVLLTGALVAMLSLIAIGQAPTLWLVALGFVCFSAGMTLYGPVVVNGMLVKLYQGREARVLALAAIGISVSAAILPPLIGSLMAYMDWRLALQSLAGGLLVVLWLTIWASVPGGVVGIATDDKPPVAVGLYRNRAFWLIGVSVAMGLNVMIVMAVCYPPYFATQGYSVADAGWFLALLGTTGLVGKGCLAWWGDTARYYAKWMAAATLLLQLVGFFLLYRASDSNAMIVALCLIGFSGGILIPMHPYLNSRYFDASVISQVTGAQMPLFLPFGLIGAPLAGYVFDQTGSYDLVLIALMVMLGIAALLVLRLEKQPV